ncbi:hypothetical protein B0T14DRAFT_497568 [Immersiella caudata]|uniref:Uncharacterized protein n=1 Tax=Immersiella caudata TaxID=314043 RepID=A0AA40BWI5_9PEZI|nr:hypothetical protein B0T14DRAFT_497568 [Immersiella caudata]
MAGAPTNNPTHGQKVNPSNPALSDPHYHGAIDPSSLAASSIRSGGAFASNEGASPGDQPASDSHAHAPGSHKQKESILDHQYSYGGQAPNHVLSQYIKDEAGPHGENLRVGGFEGSGTERKMPEPGSKDDPERAALKSFVRVKDGQGMKVAKGDFEVLNEDEQAWGGGVSKRGGKDKSSE